MIDTIYHRCLYAYLKGSRKETSMYFDMLRDEFKLSGKVNSLTGSQYRTLKDIRQALNTGAMTQRSWVDDSSVAPPQEGLEARQDELVRRIHKEAIDDLKDILGQGLWLENLEHPCPPYGRVDMLYRTEDTALPVEIKRKAGGHDLIGQILKYDLYVRLRLHYHLYAHVLPVTICSGYDQHVLHELKSHGVKTLVYSDVGARLKVVQV